MIILLFLLFVPFELHPTNAQTSWIKSGYWFYDTGFPVSDINPTLFTHLLCAFAQLNSSTYHLSIPSSNEQDFSSFTSTVKQKNPSIITLLSIGGGSANDTIFSSMVSLSSRRKSFIESTIRTARLYGFRGIDLSWGSRSTSSDMTNIGTLLDEWRAAINFEPRNSNESLLFLTVAVYYSPMPDSTVNYPVDSMLRNLDWVNVNSYDYHTSLGSNFTSAPAALYDPASQINTDYGIGEWISRGLPASKLVLGMPYYGYAWTLLNPKDNGIGAPVIGPAETPEGDLRYNQIKRNMQRYGAASVYNATYVVNYCTYESTWIGFDDVETIKAKVTYVKENRLLGYYVWQVPGDENWVLSLAAQEVIAGVPDHQKKWRLPLIISLTVAMAILLVGFMICFLRRRVLKSKGMDSGRESLHTVGYRAAAENFDSDSPNLHVFSFATIEAATNKFSIENKLGQGGFGPVYMGKLRNGQEIAVKRLSKTSRQGLEEFKNEVTLLAKLQHVNLVRVLGFCTDKEEKLLIYEYMPNKSLDLYLFDMGKRLLLDWRRRVLIIEGVTQGLLYLQEYSRLTVLHRDLKDSNILLDNEMKPKISDLGMARIFVKDEHETNTTRIVGTYGYVPPECVKEGIYSMKSDVYSFGVLLLQIISGKKNSCLHGLNEDLNLLEYAYDLWKDGKGMEFMDPSLDDASSLCKLMRCLQVALLCVQEKPEDRATILEVSSMLKNETAATATPKKPAFPTKKYEDEERQGICSVNDATISQLVPR